MEIAPGGVIPEEIIWQALPGKAGNFWPALVFGESDFERKITDYYPVSVELSFTGWGKCRATILPLEVFLEVSWDSRRWWLSTDGRMWLASLPSAALVKGISYPRRPVLAWDSRLPAPIDAARQGGDIYSSSLPMEKILKWYGTIEKIEWKDDVYCLFAKKTDSKQVVQILLGTENDITGEIIVKDDASDWLSLAAALKKQRIYPGVSGSARSMLSINATYKDMTFTVSDRDKL
jgi:hypothetical protein